MLSMAHISSPAASCTSRAANVHQSSIQAPHAGRRSRLLLAVAPVVTSSRAPTPQHPAPSQRRRRQPVAAAVSAWGASASEQFSVGSGDSSGSAGGAPDPAWQQEQTAAMTAAWEAQPPDVYCWLRAQNEALSLTPSTKEEEEGKQQILQQCADLWNSFSPASQWRAAWANLLPQQQQVTLEQHGVGTVEDLLPIIAAEHRSLPDDLRAATLKQLPPAIARLRVAAANLTEQLARKAAWEDLEPHERQWLKDHEVAAAAVAAVALWPDEQAAEPQRQWLQVLEEEWHAFPPDSRWRIAWADLVPAQQQQLLAQVGAGSVEEFVPATAAALEAVPPDQQADAMGGLPTAQQRVIAAAAGLQHEQQWLEHEIGQQEAAWEGMQPDELLWLQSVTTAHSAQPSTQQEAEQQEATLAQLGEQWSAFPPSKKWATAWAALLPSQQRQLLAKYGADDAAALLPAAAAAYAAVEPSQQVTWLTQLPAPEALLVLAAVAGEGGASREGPSEGGVGGAGKGDDER